MFKWKISWLIQWFIALWDKVLIIAILCETGFSELKCRCSQETTKLIIKGLTSWRYFFLYVQSKYLKWEVYSSFESRNVYFMILLYALNKLFLVYFFNVVFLIIVLIFLPSKIIVRFICISNDCTTIVYKILWY